MQNTILHPQRIDCFGNFGSFGQDATLGKCLFFKRHGHIHAYTALTKKVCNTIAKTIKRGKTFAVLQVYASFFCKGMM
ncbi:Uncharacterised protein [Mycobacteroides abscessus subsp. abscessus]|nr:Uncharacterised protein [Mycobacteroides abscessus subsp. abscessus]